MIRQGCHWLGEQLFPPRSKFSPDTHDVMLVSYPKSGNTWIRALVAHLVVQQPSLARMEQLIPDIYKSRGRILRNAYRFPCAGRLIKSHESFRPTYKRVIYVVRDPRDICVSYYHYLCEIQHRFYPSAMSLNEFCEIFISGRADTYGTWGEHVRGWLSADNAEFLLIQYEKLLSDPAASLTRISRFLQLNLPDTAICSAVQNCSFDRLRSKEKDEGTKWQQKKGASNSVLFFREGRAGNWDALDDNLLNKMYNKWGSQMKAVGYLE